MKTFNEYFKIPAQGTKDKTGVPCVYISHDRKRNTKAQIKESHDLHQWTDKYDNEDEDELPRSMHQHQGTKSIDWDNPHHVAIRKYTVDSGAINGRLFREHINGNVDKNERLHLDDVIGKHSLEHDLHTYSGVKFDPKEVADKDGHIHLPAFTSTSIKKNIAKSFADDKTFNGDDDGYGHHHIIHFHLKKGQKGMYVGSHPDVETDDQLSEHPGEHEFILPRNTRIKIHPDTDVYDDDRYDKRYHVHHAHVVPHDE